MRQITLLIMMLSLLIGGCTGGNTTPKEPPASGADGSGSSGTGGAQKDPRHGIARPDAEALVHNYLQQKVEGRFEAAEEMLVPRIRNAGWAKTPGWTQYEIVKATEVADGWLIETREYRTQASSLTSSIARAYYLVVKEESKLRIDMPELRWGAEKGGPHKTVATIVSPDPQAPDRRLIMTEGTARVLAEMDPDLPETFRPFGAPAETQFGVGDNGWGALALAPDLQSVAFVTRGTHALLGLVDRSGKVKGLDLWYGGGAGELAWSFDGRYLAATNASPRGIFVLELWDVASGQPVKVTGLPDGKDVSRLQWVKGTLEIRVGVERWLVDPATGRAVPSS